MDGISSPVQYCTITPLFCSISPSTPLHVSPAVYHLNASASTRISIHEVILFWYIRVIQQTPGLCLLYSHYNKAIYTFSRMCSIQQACVLGASLTCLRTGSLNTFTHGGHIYCFFLSPPVMM